MDYPKRKSIRLKNYDYSTNGAYFITICTANRRCILGDVCNDEKNIYCKLSSVGNIVDAAINEIPKHYSNVQIPCYCIMPNHVHLILTVLPATDDGRQSAVPTMVGNMKRAVSMQLGKSIWQSRFYDHVIRNEDEFIRICNYIETNPLMWNDDRYFV